MLVTPVREGGYFEFLCLWCSFPVPITGINETNIIKHIISPDLIISFTPYVDTKNHNFYATK
jgi:hypothetical protein